MPKLNNLLKILLNIYITNAKVNVTSQVLVFISNETSVYYFYNIF